MKECKGERKGRHLEEESKEDEGNNRGVVDGEVED